MTGVTVMVTVAGTLGNGPSSATYSKLSAPWKSAFGVYVSSGGVPVSCPCVGGVVRQLRGDRNGLPAAIHLPVRIGDQNNFQWGGQNAGFLGAQYDPMMLIDEKWTPGTLPQAFMPSDQVGSGGAM